MAIAKKNHSLLLEGNHKTKVNILEVIGNASFGGMEKYITNFITHLPPEEFNVICICPYESAFTTSLRNLGYKVYITPIADDPSWRSIQFTTEIVRLHEIDILHAHMPKAQALAGLAGCLTHTPVIATVHGMHFTALEHSITRLTGSYLITNCQEAYGQALAMGIPAERVTVVHNGVDIQLFTPGESSGELRNSINISKETPLIGFAARLVHEKGPDLFLRAAQHIHFARPDVHFAVVGFGAMREELVKMRDRFGLEQCVHFVGWRNDMADIYRSLDLFLHTSRSDGTSLVLMEAMACGCPVAALDVGGIREVVESDSTGLLAPANDWEGIAVRIIELLSNKNWMNSMKKEARICVEKKFDFNTKVQCITELFRSIIHNGTNGHTAIPNGKLVAGNGSLAFNGTNGEFK